MDSNRTLPASWVERIFNRMQGLYGSLWVDRWKTGELKALPNGGSVDVGMLNAKATWACELGGFAGQGDAIGKALERCGSIKMPPTLPEFLQLLRDEASRPAKAAQIGYTPTAEDLARQREASQQVAQVAKAKAAQKFDGLGWARNPGSPYAMAAVFEEAQRGNKVMQGVLDDLIARKVCDDKGHLIRRGA